MPAPKIGPQFTVRLSPEDLERLKRIMEHHRLTYAGTLSRSVAIRWLIEREAERLPAPPKKKSGKS
jgi:hypothetical protein